MSKKVEDQENEIFIIKNKLVQKLMKQEKGREQDEKEVEYSGKGIIKGEKEQEMENLRKNDSMIRKS